MFPKILIKNVIVKTQVYPLMFMKQLIPMHYCICRYLKMQKCNKEIAGVSPSFWVSCVTPNVWHWSGQSYYFLSSFDFKRRSISVMSRPMWPESRSISVIPDLRVVALILLICIVGALQFFALTLLTRYYQHSKLASFLIIKSQTESLARQNARTERINMKHM